MDELYWERKWDILMHEKCPNDDWVESSFSPLSTSDDNCRPSDAFTPLSTSLIRYYEISIQYLVEIKRTVC